MAENLAMLAGTANAPDSSKVPAYVIAQTTTGFLPLEVFQSIALGEGSAPVAQSVPQRTTDPLFGAHIRDAVRLLRRQ